MGGELKVCGGTMLYIYVLVLVGGECRWGVKGLWWHHMLYLYVLVLVGGECGWELKGQYHHDHQGMESE